MERKGTTRHRIEPLCQADLYNTRRRGDITAEATRKRPKFSGKQRREAIVYGSGSEIEGRGPHGVSLVLEKRG